MQKNFKVFFTISIALLLWLNSFGQEDGQFKDVVLDGKPAKLNVVTGEITLVNPEDKKSLAKFDDFVEKSENNAKNSPVIEANSDYYTVKENETLLDIANRYKTTLTVLKEANNLETTLVDPGQKLRVKNFETQPENTTNVITAEPTAVLTSTINNSDIHIVEAGETLYSLSKRYGFTVEELKNKNGLSSNLIKVGQELNISHSDYKKRSTDNAVWTVSKGDTLYNIAKRNGLSVDELKSINNLSDNLILVGQKLKLK